MEGAKDVCVHKDQKVLLFPDDTESLLESQLTSIVSVKNLGKRITRIRLGYDML